MAISKSNIEAYLLDYLEGNLDPLLTAELMAFMTDNPGYEKWLPEYDGHLCLTGNPSFEDKPLLKKDFGDVPDINPDNFDEFCIASAEGLLPAAEIQRLKDFLSRNPEKQHDYDIYHHLRLIAEPSLVFPGKAGLKKPVTRLVPMRFIYYALGAAASVALLLMLTHRRPPVEMHTATIPRDPVEVRENSTSGHQSAAEPVPVMHGKQTPENRPAPGPMETVSPGSRAGSEESPVLPELIAMEPIREVRLHPRHSLPGMQRTIVPVTTNANAGNLKLYAPAPGEDPSVIKLLASVMKKLNFWDAAESALTGFNYLTESQLELSKTTDQNGRLTSLALGNGQYTITGNKIK